MERSSDSSRRNPDDKGTPLATPPPDNGRGGASAATASTLVKADLGTRFLAMLIDSAIAFVLGLVPVIGGIVGAAYFVCRDGLEFDFMNRRSVGKQVMKLRPVRLDGQPMDIETSVRRNWMWGLGAIFTVLLWIPFIGWIFAILLAPVALAIGLYEAYRVITDKEGRRWGDTIAGTIVVAE